ncbi:MAG: hypothetical protein P8Y60_18145 [Calditrichota bacterium]
MKRIDPDSSWRFLSQRSMEPQYTENSRFSLTLSGEAVWAAAGPTECSLCRGKDDIMSKKRTRQRGKRNKRPLTWEEVRAAGIGLPAVSVVGEWFEPGNGSCECPYQPSRTGLHPTG